VFSSREQPIRRPIYMQNIYADREMTNHNFNIAFADKAFKEDGTTRPEDLHNFEISHFKEPLSIQWKSEIRDTPVLRWCENGAISAEPMTFSDFNLVKRKKIDEPCTSKLDRNLYRNLTRQLTQSEMTYAISCMRNAT